MITRDFRDIIYQGLNLNIPYKGMFTPLSLAVRHNNLKAVELLIEAGAGVNVEDGYGRTAIIHSCTMNYDDISQYLLSVGADINHIIKNKHFNTGSSALSIAAGRNYNAVKFIIDNGGDITSDSIGGVALTKACSNDYPFFDIIKLLVYNGANINSQYYTTITPLMYMCMQYVAYPEIVIFLIEFGADKNLVNNEGKTALWYAKYSIHEEPFTEIINILKNNILVLENVEYITEFIGQDCPICTEPLEKNSVKTLCGHYFHQHCLMYWKTKANTCPICRAPNSFFGSKRSKRSKKSKKRSKKLKFKI